MLNNKKLAIYAKTIPNSIGLFPVFDNDDKKYYFLKVVFLKTFRKIILHDKPVRYSRPDRFLKIIYLKTYNMKLALHHLQCFLALPTAQKSQTNTHKPYQ